MPVMAFLSCPADLISGSATQPLANVLHYHNPEFNLHRHGVPTST
jgi:hypothetical protein